MRTLLGRVFLKWSEVKLLSHVQLFATPWTVAYQVPPSMGFSMARILEWVAISFSRRSSQPRGWTWVSRIIGRRFTVWATREVILRCWFFLFITLNTLCYSLLACRVSAEKSADRLMGVPTYVICCFPLGAFPLRVQLVKNPPAMQETLVQFLDWEDPLEKG